ncbi:MAG: hypothetical protein ACRD0H_03490, partial [Actinomycetes bacterium]
RRLRAAADPQALDSAEHLVTDAQRLAAILDDLLLAADPAATNQRTEIDLATLAAEVVAQAEPAGC